MRDAAAALVDGDYRSGNADANEDGDGNNRVTRIGHSFRNGTSRPPRDRVEDAPFSGYPDGDTSGSPFNAGEQYFDEVPSEDVASEAGGDISGEADPVMQPRQSQRFRGGGRGRPRRNAHGVGGFGYGRDAFEYNERAYDDNQVCEG
jgi:hypothetical protein